jgi:hypothetical protein
MKMKLHHMGIVGVLSVLAACAGEERTGVGEDHATAERPLTIENFVSHPRVVEVREWVKRIDDQVTSKTLVKHEKVFPDAFATCDAGGEDHREKYVDASGAVRKFVQVFATEHSEITTTYYYSNDGKLRFVFDVSNSAEVEESGAFHSFVFEKRVYFNAEGQVFWEVDREGQATGAPPDLSKSPFTKAEDVFEALDPDVEKDAKKAFDNAIVCL